MVGLLSDSVRDMVVYNSGGSNTDRCNIFEQIHPDWQLTSRVGGSKHHYCLTLVNDGLPEDGQLSLNRCTPNMEPFNAKRFKLGTPTPMAENECSSAVPFILSFNLDRTITSNAKLYSFLLSEESMSSVASDASGDRSCTPFAGSRDEFSKSSVKKQAEIVKNKRKSYESGTCQSSRRLKLVEDDSGYGVLLSETKVQRSIYQLSKLEVSRKSLPPGPGPD